MNFSDTSKLFGSDTAPISGVGNLLQRLHLDGPLLGGLLVICVFGLVVLYSAVAQNFDLWLQQLIRLFVALVAMLIVAQFQPDLIRRWTPWGYLAGLVLLILVLVTGEVGQGAQRWLDIGIRFQPSEIMRLAVPMMVAWYLHDRQLPPKLIDRSDCTPTRSRHLTPHRDVWHHCYRAGRVAHSRHADAGGIVSARHLRPVAIHAGIPEATRPDLAQS